MKLNHYGIALFLTLQFQLLSCEFVTAGVIAAGSAVTAGLLAGFSVLNCMVNECCNDKWISTNFTDLDITLTKKLYGQHLVIAPVVKHLKGHARPNPSKAMALSFHGGTGTGKNYVSQIIAEKMYRKGMDSKFVHLISATKEYPHREMVALHKDSLREKIEKAVKQCGRSLIIIDEMDKMPPGLIDTLKPYLDYYPHLDNVDYRKATFIFLSNTAGNDINEKTIESWSKNVKRETIKLKEMEEVIRLPALNSKGGGLWHSELITKNLISAYIPFLPLERAHVKQCIREGLVTSGYYNTQAEVGDSVIQEIADQLTYSPENVNVFSTTGCKRIQEKIDYVMG